ncbi:MAG: hypothetical protein ACEQSK_13530 [Sphingomonadaceae bacterium]
MESRNTEVQEMVTAAQGAPEPASDAIERAFQAYQTALAAYRALKNSKPLPLRPYTGRDLLR